MEITKLTAFRFMLSIPFIATVILGCKNGIKKETNIENAKKPYGGLYFKITTEDGSTSESNMAVINYIKQKNIFTITSTGNPNFSTVIKISNYSGSGTYKFGNSTEASKKNKFDIIFSNHKVYGFGIFTSSYSKLKNEGYGDVNVSISEFNKNNTFKVKGVFSGIFLNKEENKEIKINGEFLAVKP